MITCCGLPIDLKELLHAVGVQLLNVSSQGSECPDVREQIEKFLAQGDSLSKFHEVIHPRSCG